MEMIDVIVSKEEQDEIKEIISLFILLSKEDRAILLSIAGAFKVRRDMEKSKKDF